ncbi:MAG: EamA family transporter RarD [Hydrogenophaga sp.]|uniref:EamA family transporter RarD n=1 Tax=Hydrogenophaga sp. TaxID=1904254 RepID=UPI0024AA7818|nr:EamA family transporter RarD [Hydrogenophaga sp.]MDI3512649.1 chloramphenicol-sensitive protein RarD [Betaproteobacteria bacterium]
MTRKGLLYGISAYGLWGLFPLFFKQLQHVGSLEVVLHRMVWSLAFVLLVLAALRRWTWLREALRSPRLLATFAVSSLLLAANWLTYIWAVNNGHVLDASLGYFILPLVNVALGFVFLHERPRPGQWLAFGIAAAGVLWLALLTGHVPWIALGLALSFGFYGLIRKLAPLGALEGMSLETMLLAPLAAVALLWGHQSGSMPAHDTHTWLLFLLCGPVTAIPLLLFSAGARRVPLSTMGILQYLTPTILLFLGTLLYGEPFAGPRLAGFALIWTALLLYSVDGWRHRARPAAA